MRSIFTLILVFLPAPAFVYASSSDSLFSLVKQRQTEKIVARLASFIDDRPTLARLLTRQDCAGKTILHHAVGALDAQSLAIARFLITLWKIAELNLDTPDATGRTLLHYAYTKPAVEALIDEGAHATICDKQGNTPLHTNKSPRAIAALIAAGADVNACNDTESTPLHIHAHRDEVVRILLQAKACPNRLDKYFMTPFDKAYKTCNSQFLHLYFHPSVQRRMLMAKQAMITLCMQYGQARQHPEEHKKTVAAFFKDPLLVACAMGDENTVSSLLSHKKVREEEARLLEERGTTPLIVAAACGYKNIVDILLRAGSCRSRLDRNGNAALTLAIANRISNLDRSEEADEARSAIIRMLVLHGQKGMTQTISHQKKVRFALGAIPESAFR